MEGEAKLLHKKRGKADKVYLILFNDVLVLATKKTKQNALSLHVEGVTDMSRLSAFIASEKALGDKEKDKVYCHALTLIFHTADLHEGRHEFRFFFKTPTDEWMSNLQTIFGVSTLTPSLIM